MDTKPLEIESESYIQHELIKYGFKVTKPTFDTEGADLLIVDNIKKKYTHFLKIQCKGRTLKSNGSYIEIPKEYVTDNFIVFLYVKNEKFENFLFTFFYEDIIMWNIRDNKYVLNFSSAKFNTTEFLDRKFKFDAVEKIQQKLISSKIKKYTSLIIDKGFLYRAISKTLSIYSELHPNKTFNRPKMNEVILNILSMYDNFKSNEKIINCYIYSYCEDPEKPDDVIYNKKFITSDGVKGKIFIEKTDDFVSNEILELMERIINTENIILVADDIVYEEPLHQLKQKDIDITLVMFSTDDGRRMFTHHKWGDVIYPLARSIGLEQHEW